MSQDGKTKRVVIIGAGASGIGAARTLSASGAEVIVLEGRDRIGGRMKKHCLTKNLAGSPRTGAEHYVNIQLGANWIHGMESSNPMFEVAQKLGLELYQTSSDDDPGDDVILFDSGARKVSDLSSSDKVAAVAYGRVSKEDYHESLSRYEWIKEYVDHISVNYDKEDISLQAAFDLALKASESEIFGPCSEAQKRCLTWLYDRVSIDLGALSSKVSLNCYAEGVSDGAGGEGLVKHVGYSYVLDHLAREFPLDIRLSKCVAKVSVHNARADKPFELTGIATPAAEQLALLAPQLERCTLKDGRYVCIECADGEVLVADACVVTVPIGALQAGSIDFCPRAPSVITSVCSALKPGLMNLVWLWYPEVFWPEECNFLGIARDGEPTQQPNDQPAEQEEVTFTTFLIPPIYDNCGVRQPVLMCQVHFSSQFTYSLEVVLLMHVVVVLQIVGPYATTIENMDDADIAAAATATLRAMFGADRVPDAIGCAHSQWGSDPFSRGSWSYFPYRADSSSFNAGNGVPSGETARGCETHPCGAIVGSVRESGPAGEAGADGSSVAASLAVTAPFGAFHISSVPPSAATAQAELSTKSATTATTTESYTASSPTSPTGVSQGVHHTVAAALTTTVTTAPVRSVTISEAASSVLGGLGNRGVSPSAVRKYSDFGCTSDGTDSGSSDSEGDDSDSEQSGPEGPEDLGHVSSGNRTDAGTTTGLSSSSSSDEANHGHGHSYGTRSLDDVLSAHLYYASEAMSVMNRGTVHGAYLSGIREANKILAFLDETTTTRVK
jgi:monoamine oxidase